MIRFVDSNGKAVWVAPAHVITVADGGAGCAIVSCTERRTLKVVGQPEEISRQITKAVG